MCLTVEATRSWPSLSKCGDETGAFKATRLEFKFFLYTLSAVTVNVPKLGESTIATETWQDGRESFFSERLSVVSESTFAPKDIILQKMASAS